MAAKKTRIIGIASTTESHTESSASRCKKPKQMAQQIKNMMITAGC